MRGLVAIIGILGSSTSCSANDDTPAPQVGAVAPSHAATGTIVTVSGSYFCHQPATDDPLSCAYVGTVDFGTSAADASQYTDSSITVAVPGGAGAVSVKVEVAGEVSNAVMFTID